VIRVRIKAYRNEYNSQHLKFKKIKPQKWDLAGRATSSPAIAPHLEPYYYPQICYGKSAF
jgi:hypothetical protein